MMMEQTMQEKTNSKAKTGKTKSYKQPYKALKEKLKWLIYENETFKNVLNNAQQNLLIGRRDRKFLMERLIQYEPIYLYNKGDSQPKGILKLEDKKSKAIPPTPSASKPRAKNLKTRVNKKQMPPRCTASEEIDKQLQPEHACFDLFPEVALTVPERLFDNDMPYHSDLHNF